jgi:hypothetical protein
MTDLLMRPATILLAAVPPGDADPAAGKGPEWGKAAPIGLLIILLMGLALFLLIKSMNRNLRKVPASFDGDDASGNGSTTASDGGDRNGGLPTDGDGEAGPADGGDGDPGWPADDDGGTRQAEVSGRPLRQDERH